MDEWPTWEEFFMSGDIIPFLMIAAVFLMYLRIVSIIRKRK